METSNEILKIRVKPGQIIFAEGDDDLDFYIIEKGQVQIYVTSPQKKKIELMTIGEGESFGEFALLDKQPRSASAMAVTEGMLIKVSQAGYNQLLGELPIWASSMLRSFSKRLRLMNEKVRSNAAK